MKQETLFGEKIEQLEKEIARVKSLYQKCLKYQEVDPEVALSQARKSAEAICKHIYVNEEFEKGGKPASKMMLNDLIGTLSKKRVVPQHIIIALGTIQHYGNFGTHDQGEDSDYITREFVETCLSALSTVVNWYFQEYSNLPDQMKGTDSSKETAEPKSTSKNKTENTLSKPQPAKGIDEILGRYREQLQDTAENKGKIRGFFKEVVGDKLGGVYKIYLDDTPEKRMKELMIQHGIDFRKHVHIAVDNDRVGDDDSSTLVTDDVISVFSNSGLVYGGDDMKLKLSLGRCNRIECRFDMVFLYAGEREDAEEFHFPLTVLIDNETAINKNKIDPLIALLNDIFAFCENDESNKINEILSTDNETLLEKVEQYKNEHASLPSYKVFTHLAKYHCGNGNIDEAKGALKMSSAHFEMQYGSVEKLEKNPLKEKILEDKGQIEVVENLLNAKAPVSGENNAEAH